MARRRESLGNVEASRSERYTGAGIVDSDVESERDTVPIFDNGGRICMLNGGLAVHNTPTRTTQISSVSPPTLCAYQYAVNKSSSSSSSSQSRLQGFDSTCEYRTLARLGEVDDDENGESVRARPHRTGSYAIVIVEPFGFKFSVRYRQPTTLTRQIRTTTGPPPFSPLDAVPRLWHPSCGTHRPKHHTKSICKPLDSARNAKQ